MRNSDKNYLSILATIYNTFIDWTYLPEETDWESLNNFTAKYKVTNCQAKALAYLEHFPHSAIAGSKLLAVMSDDGIHASANELAELVDRNFITVRKLNNGDSCYSMANAARKAFKNGQAYGLKLMADCYKALLGCSLDDILDEDWKERFYSSAEASADHQIADAIEILGIKGLGPEVQDAFWVLVRQFAQNFTSPYAFRSIVSLQDEQASVQVQLKSSMGELVRLGLAVTIPIEPYDDTKETDRFVLAVRPVELLFHGHEEFIRYDKLSNQANILLAKDIVRKELFFNEKSQKEIDNLRTILSPEGFRRAKDILIRQKRNPGIQSLFWGPPGTGKTEVVKQLARESGRDILMFDAAKATSTAWGATEKFYRALFLGYSYMVAVSDKAPILMLNEADQLLSKRLTDVNTAIARSENTVSNILLEAFESTPGIILLTTNLASNFDDAFDRRLMFKTELSNPDAPTRKKIWKSSIPELTDEESARLAECFDLSGGQISNIVAKRNLAELYYDGDRGYNYIVGLCREEMETPVKGTSRKIGF
ncbi:MAG: ATP-binding protein [Bacteroidia bacterium]|nr:ATP-binding protein [Bacteroidia bacterium]